MNKFDEIKQILDELEEDLEKFYEKGNKAAGTRARKTLQKLKQKAQDIRIDILDVRDRDSGYRSVGDRGFDSDPDDAAEIGGSDDW